MTSPQRGAKTSDPADEQQRRQTLSRTGRFRGCRDPSGSHSRRLAATMPRRTVQEVTVQDVQKRRNPNKHYVRRLQNLSLGFFFSSFSSWRTEEKQRGDQITAEPGGNRRMVGWFGVWSRTENDTAGVGRGRGLFYRSGSKEEVEDKEKKLVSSVARNQSSGW